MTTYTANFSNGRKKTIANSKREYAAAYMVVITGMKDRQTGETKEPMTMMGFSRDADLAQKAITKESKWYIATYGGKITESEVVEAVRS